MGSPTGVRLLEQRSMQPDVTDTCAGFRRMRCQHGDGMLRRRSTPEREAGRLLTAIYRDHSASSYRYAYHLTRSREDADDLVQIAFLGLYRTLSSGETVMSPAAWLATTIKRRAINLARQRREQPASDQLDALAVSGNGEGSSASEAAEEL